MVFTLPIRAKLEALPRLLRREWFSSQCIGCGDRSNAFCVECAPAYSEQIAFFIDSFASGRDRLPVFALGAYEGALRSAMLAFKTGRRDIGDSFGEMLISRFGALAAIHSADWVSIPTTARRRRERGFDGALFFARRLAQSEGRLPRDLLVQDAGDSQRGRSRRERLSAAGRFGVRRASVAHGMRVVLVDDVVTTGASIREACRVLEARGASVVAALAVARALENQDGDQVTAGIPA